MQVDAQKVIAELQKMVADQALQLAALRAQLAGGDEDETKSTRKGAKVKS